MQTVPQGEAERVIELLAQKLSVPTEHLWDVLTQQAYANAVIAVGKVTVLVALTWALRKASERAMSWAEKDNSSDFGSAFVVGLVGVIVAIVMFIVLLLATLNLVDAMGYVINPEYFALKTILKVLE